VAQRKRRKTPTSKRRDWRQIGFYILSFLVVLSMAIGYVLLVTTR